MAHINYKDLTKACINSNNKSSNNSNAFGTFYIINQFVRLGSIKCKSLYREIVVYIVFLHP